ncbi:hypothetical protein NHX12_027662 [Muraenolepis orangiensis]|uniref:G-protein coupled receptors family 1 profile domain-containing protein n=1 Tax=Muraenolepis orangiensis TaxID=630683 RepID=A0A9Q0ECP6_9TELE|nr:hypothetical protein NHX12_027662 [Muraenolepis orangiensis]
MEGLDDYDLGDYTQDNGTVENLYQNVTGAFDGSIASFSYSVMIINVIISLGGFAGNAVVIWISGWKMKRTVNTTFYLSLAISDCLFCACLPVNIGYVMTSHWPFGPVLCKLVSSTLIFNMFSSVFVLVLISVDRCVMAVFPVWSHNRRTVKAAVGVLVLTWVLSATLTVPSLLYRSTRAHGGATECYSDYKHNSVHRAVVLARFVGGFLLPFVVIVSCTAILYVKLRRLTIKSTKPYKVMVALVLSFFLCWIPYHTVVFLEVDIRKHDLTLVQTGLAVGTTLAAANSFVNPFLYVFIGNKFKQTLRRSLMQRMEYAMAEDGRTLTPVSQSVRI